MSSTQLWPDRTERERDTLDAAAVLELTGLGLRVQEFYGGFPQAGRRLGQLFGAAGVLPGTGSGRGYDYADTDGLDAYRVQVWPRMSETEPVVRKVWPGWANRR